MASSTHSAADGAGDRPVPFRPGDSTSRRVLEEVLQQTATMYSLEPGIEPGDLGPLLEVARRFPNAPFEFDPVMVELVRTAFRRQLGGAWKTVDELNAAADRVARTLYENPESHARLSTLWDRLHAAVK